MLEINDLYKKPQAHEIITDEIGKPPEFMKLQIVLDTLMHELRSKSRTARTLIPCIEYNDKLQHLISTEIRVQLNVQLLAVGRMLHLFEATSN